MDDSKAGAYVFAGKNDLGYAVTSICTKPEATHTTFKILNVQRSTINMVCQAAPDKHDLRCVITLGVSVPAMHLPTIDSLRDPSLFSLQCFIQRNDVPFE